jgi:L-cysteine/cystine lyase
MQEEWTFPYSAQRLEWGGRQTAAVAGQVASLRWLQEEVGYPWIYKRISSLNTYAFQMLKDLPNVTILTPEPGCSGLLTFRLMGTDPDVIVKRLRDEYAIHIRSIQDRQALRISTGFYNTEAEIDLLGQTLRTM